jgi:hypothetical protein
MPPLTVFDPKKEIPTMADAVRRQHWGDQFENLMTEIARQAVVCHVKLLEPGAVEAVLRNDEAACGSTNPVAFKKMRDALMVAFVVQGKAYESLGPLETEALLQEIRETFGTRFSGKLGGPAGA